MPKFAHTSTSYNPGAGFTPTSGYGLRTHNREGNLFIGIMFGSDKINRSLTRTAEFGQKRSSMNGINAEHP